MSRMVEAKLFELRGEESFDMARSCVVIFCMLVAAELPVLRERI